MYRQGLRRCANAASPLRSVSTLARSHAAITITRHNLVSHRPVSAWRNIAAIGRTYSTEAAAPSRVEEAAGSEPVELFKDLGKLGVHGNLLRAITEDMRYERMTPVQAKTVNPALKGTDIVAQAKTGTGKTLAFLLPLLQRMINEDPSLASRGASRRASSDDIRGIVLSPTRELAEQIATEARALCRHTGLVVQTAVGGTNRSQMLRQTQRQGCHLLVATPGRLNDLLRDASTGIEAPNLAAMVLDEADRMLDVGFEKELEDILHELPDPKDKERQTMLVSATIPDDVIRLARSMVRPQNFEFVQTIPEHESLTHDKVPQKVVPVSSWTNMFPTLFELMDREAQKAEQDPDSPPFKAIVYFNTTAMTELAGEIGYGRNRERMTNLQSHCIHSKLTQMARTRASEAFRRQRSGVLFSSDVTARGMDFPNVTHVIQIDVPRERESYIHRLGRTGRQDKYGEGWLLLPPLSVRSARKLLSGLPLKQDKTLESSEADITSADQLPPLHQQFQDLARRAGVRAMTNAYTVLFSAGSGAEKQELAEDLYHWATKGWGWDAPPRVGHNWAAKAGLDARSPFLNVGEVPRFSDDRSGGFGGKRGGRSGGFGGRGGGQNADPFTQMRHNVRSDQRDGRGRGGGRSTSRSYF